VVIGVSEKHISCNLRTLNRGDWSIITVLFTYDQLLLAENKGDIQRVAVKLNEILKEYSI
jgi:hypothetical protein